MPCHWHGVTFDQFGTFGLGWGWDTGGSMGDLDCDSLVPTGKFHLTLVVCKLKDTLVGLMSTWLRDMVHPCSVVRM